MPKFSFDDIINLEISIILFVIYFIWKPIIFRLAIYNYNVALILLFIYYIILILLIIKLFHDYFMKDLMDWEVPQELKHIDDYLYP